MHTIKINVIEAYILMLYLCNLKIECIGTAKYWGAKCGGAKCGNAKCGGAKCGAQSVRCKMWGVEYGTLSVGAQRIGRKVGKPLG